MKKKLNLYKGLKPVIITGDAGIGKTYTTYEWARENYKENNIFVINGTSSTDETYTIGMWLRNEVGGMEYAAGPLTQAFLRAREGEDVCVIFDEIGRVPKELKDYLVPTLTPDNLGKLTLTTNKAVKDDMGNTITESIVIDADKLTFIATMNIGNDYSADLGDRAFVDRFVTISFKDDGEFKVELTPLLNRVLEKYAENMNNKTMYPMSNRIINELAQLEKRIGDGDVIDLEDEDKIKVFVDLLDDYERRLVRSEFGDELSEDGRENFKLFKEDVLTNEEKLNLL